MCTWNLGTSLECYFLYLSFFGFFFIQYTCPVLVLAIHLNLNHFLVGHLFPVLTVAVYSCFKFPVSQAANTTTTYYFLLTARKLNYKANQVCKSPPQSHPKLVLLFFALQLPKASYARLKDLIYYMSRPFSQGVLQVWYGKLHKVQTKHIDSQI